MSSSKPLLAAAVLVGAVVGGLIPPFLSRRPLVTVNRDLQRLQAEHTRLEAHAAEAMTDHEGRVTAVQELVRPAGGHLASLHARLTMVQASHDALPTAVAHPLKYCGYDTPLHSAESFVWACYNSNPEMIAHSVYLDDAALAEAEKVRAGLPPEMQARFPTALDLVGMLQAYDNISHPTPNSEDYFIDYPPPESDGPDQLQGRGGLVWHRTADGWKVAIPAAKVRVLASRVLSASGA